MLLSTSQDSICSTVEDKKKQVPLKRKRISCQLDKIDGAVV